MKHYSVLLIILVYIGTGCKETSNGPPNGLPLGKRDYVWSIDTLRSPGSYQIDMQGMYATGRENIFVVGYNDINKSQMFHYNGEQWTIVPLTTAAGGRINNFISLTSIHGTAANNIWSVGQRRLYKDDHLIDSSLVIHWDGNGWYDQTPKEGRGLYCLWVFSPTLVFTGGNQGLLWKYDGDKWTKYEMEKELFFSAMCGLSPSEVYAMGARNDAVLPLDSSGYFLFKYDGASWIKIDSVMRIPGAPPEHFGYTLSTYDGLLYSSGPNIYKYVNKTWAEIFKGDVSSISGSWQNNIFAVGGSIFHYNGQDWYEFTQFPCPDLGWWGCYTDGGEVFILGTTGFKSFILHGR